MSAQEIRAAGLAALLGGLLLVVWAAIMSFRPPGGDHEYVSVHDLAPLLFVSLVLISAGLAAYWAGHGEAFGRLGLLGAGIGICGAGLLGAAMVFMTSDPESDTLPFLIPAGLLVLPAGSALLAVAILRTKLRPGWPAVLLLAASVVLLGGGMGGWRAWLFAPYGVAWVPLGYALRAASGESDPPPDQS